MDGSPACTTRYLTQPRVDPQFGMRWRPRRRQDPTHHRASNNCPTGLIYACNLNWDEYADWATDDPTTAVEAVPSGALTGDAHHVAEAFASLPADHLTAATPNGQTTTGSAAGVEL